MTEHNVQEIQKQIGKVEGRIDGLEKGQDVLIHSIENLSSDMRTMVRELHEKQNHATGQAMQMIAEIRESEIKQHGECELKFKDLSDRQDIDDDNKKTKKDIRNQIIIGVMVAVIAGLLMLVLSKLGVNIPS